MLHFVRQLLCTFIMDISAYACPNEWNMLLWRVSITNFAKCQMLALWQVHLSAKQFPNLHFSVIGIWQGSVVTGFRCDCDGIFSDGFIANFIDSQNRSILAENCAFDGCFLFTARHDRFRLSVRPSVWHSPVSCQNNSSYDRAVFTGG